MPRLPETYNNEQAAEAFADSVNMFSPDIAIDHDPEAISMHEAIRPDTLHFINDVYELNPHNVAVGRKVGLLWMSPDCKHFSKAKGGQPQDGEHLPQTDIDEDEIPFLKGRK